jgi:hypothetical protein
VHEHDADGVLVASRVTREPEWDVWQRSLALAGFDLDRETGPHGHPMWEATDPTALDPEGDYRYVTDDPHVDAAERSRQQRIKRWRDENGKDADMSGLIFHTRKVLARDD